MCEYSREHSCVYILGIIQLFLLLLFLFLTFSVLVANPKKLLYTVANPARGLLLGKGTDFSSIIK